MFPKPACPRVTLLPHCPTEEAVSRTTSLLLQTLTQGRKGPCRGHTKLPEGSCGDLGGLWTQSRQGGKKPGESAHTTETSRGQQDVQGKCAGQEGQELALDPRSPDFKGAGLSRLPCHPQPWRKEMEPECPAFYGPPRACTPPLLGEL